MTEDTMTDGTMAEGEETAMMEPSGPLCERGPGRR